MSLQKRLASGSRVAVIVPRRYNDPATGHGGWVGQSDRTFIDLGLTYCYKVYLTTLNGDKFSYDLPMTIGKLKAMLPQLDPELDYNIIHGVRIMKESELLKDADYNLSVVIIKLDMASWCPRAWYKAGCVPEDARDNDDCLPMSLDEAGKAIYYVYKFKIHARGLAHFGRDDADGEIQCIVNDIKCFGWCTWSLSLTILRCRLKLGM